LLGRAQRRLARSSGNIVPDKEICFTSDNQNDLVVRGVACAGRYHYLQLLKCSR
jgi:hypothetical protein